MKPGPVQAGKPGPAQAGKPMPMELEIPEEVLEVEPLEPEVPKGGGQPHPATEFDFLTEAGQGAAPLLSEEIEKPVAAFGEEEQFPFQPNMEAVSPAEEEQKSGDDFTTDTLAELYIAQGFYEKAIDIYERMLADRPTNQRLSEKLAQVRSMAAGTAPAEAPKAEPGSGALYGDAGPGEFAYQGTDAFAQTAPLDAGFNAMEYVPPAEEAFKPVEYASPVEHRTAEEPFRVPKPKSAAVGRKETIERLESWLKQIAKEK